MSLDWNFVFGTLFVILVFIYFFWNPFLNILLYMFVPERIKITGIIIGTKKEKSSFCWPPMGENDHFFTPLDLVKVTDYYVVVKSNQYELPVTIKVSKDLFNSVSKNQEIAIECKKFSWKKDTDYEEIKMHITF